MQRRRAFVAFDEMLVLLAILALLIAILLPSLSRARELARRSVCAANLSGGGKAIAMYANQYRGNFPAASAARIRGSDGSAGQAPRPAPEEGFVLMFDYARAPTAGIEDGLHRWQGVVDSAYKGEVKYPHVQIADKDASYAFPGREIFLLARQNYAMPAMFACPSTGHEADPMRADQPGHGVPAELGLRAASEVVPAPQLWDFLGPQYLDYGYMFGHDADGQKANESLDPSAPVVADSNPYIRAALAGRPPAAATDTRNSLNHGGQGQNVLFGDLHVAFCDRPTKGLDGDNIYTWWYSRAGDAAGAAAAGKAPTAVPGGGGDPPVNYLFDVVSQTDSMLIP